VLLLTNLAFYKLSFKLALIFVMDTDICCVIVDVTGIAVCFRPESVLHHVPLFTSCELFAMKFDMNKMH